MTRLSLLDWCIMFAEAALLIVLNVRLGEVLAGSLVFLLMIPMFFYFSYVYKVFQEELSRLALAALCLTGLNAIAYYERFGAVQRFPVLVAYSAISVVFILAICQVYISLIRVPKSGPPEADPRKRELIGNIAGMFFGIPFFVLMLFAVPSGIVVWIGQKSWLVQAHWLGITTLFISWQVVGAVVHRAFLKKVTDQQILYVIKATQKMPTRNFKQRVAWTLLVLFAMGSLAEIGRGLWIFWIGSFAFWTLTLNNSWKVWKHIFGEESVDVPPGEVPPGYNLLTNLRMVVFTIVLASVYGIGLTVLLGLTAPKHF